MYDFYGFLLVAIGLIIGLVAFAFILTFVDWWIEDRRERKAFEFWEEQKEKKHTWRGER